MIQHFRRISAWRSLLVEKAMQRSYRNVEPWAPTFSNCKRFMVEPNTTFITNADILKGARKYVRRERALRILGAGLKMRNIKPESYSRFQ